MRIFSYFLLIGAAVLVTHLRSGVDAFTLGRNATLVIDVEDSHEMTDIADSKESNQTSKEKDSLEVDSTHLVVKRNPLGIVPALDQQPVIQLQVDSDYSWEDLIDDIAKLDRTEHTSAVGSQPAEATQRVIDHDDSLEDVLEDLAIQQILGTPQVVSDVSLVAPSNAPATEMAVDQIAQKDLGIPAAHTGSVGVFVDYDDDFSLEDFTELVNPHAVQLTTTDFHHLPDTLFAHPTSDDWFLVKHFMDDHHVWELGDELVKEYFWQPIKASDGLVVQSTEQQPPVQK